MSKRKSNLGGRSNFGSKSWKQLMLKNEGSIVTAGTVIVAGNRTLRAGQNVYKRKQVLHAKINGRVSIKNKKVSIIKEILK